jgi:hypothetical protein
MGSFALEEVKKGHAKRPARSIFAEPTPRSCQLQSTPNKEKDAEK